MAFLFKSPKIPEEERSGYMRARRRAFSGPLMFVVVVVAAIFVMSVFFRVEVIEVVGNSHYTAEEIIRAVDIEEGDNLFFFDRFAAVGRAFSKLPYIETVTVERSLPNKVVITVEETTALAYLQLGEEKWTLDHNCKVLGKAAEGEEESLLPIVGMHPGTLMIGEPLETADGDETIVAYIAEVLYQLEERGLYRQVGRVDFSNPRRVTFTYADKYTVVLGDSSNVEYKFGMLVSAMSQLLDGDVGIINVSDGNTAHFSPN